MPLPIPSWELFLGVAPETTWGTAVAATDYWPIMKPRFSVVYEPIEDIGFRSNASELQAWYQGVGSTVIDCPDMLFYPSASGHLIKAVLGVDTISGAGPFTHTLTLLNTALPESLTLTKFWGGVATADQSAGVYINELQFKFQNPGKLAVSAKGRGKIQTQATKPTFAADTAGVFLPWQATFSLGSGNTKIYDATITLTRPVEGIWGFNNSQDLTGINSGPLRVKGQIIAASTDLTELNFYLNNSQPVASILFTSGTNTLTFQMSKAAFVSPSELDHGNPYARTILTFDGVANATDAGTGNAPFKCVLVNGRNTAY